MSPNRVFFIIAYSFRIYCPWLNYVRLLILARQILHRYDKYLTKANLHNP